MFLKDGDGITAFTRLINGYYPPPPPRGKAGVHSIYLGYKMTSEC